MKVELSKIRLAVTAITKSIVATIPSKDNKTMRHKHDVSSDFLKCIIDYGANQRWNITGGDEGDKEYEVACIEKKGFKQALYTRNEVIKILKHIEEKYSDKSLKFDMKQFIKVNLK